MITCENEKSHKDLSKLWCSQITDTDIIIFGTELTTVFDTNTKKVSIIQDGKERCVPDKRCEIKKFGNEVSMILEPGGNLGIYSLSMKKWNVQPHIVLGL